MFTRCQIDIVQNYQNSNSRFPKWIVIDLLRPRMITILGIDENQASGGDAVIWEYIRQQHETIQYWGRWKQGMNSLTADTSYTLGLASPSKQYWTFSHVHRQLDFIEAVHWTNAGPGEIDFAMPLSLHNVWVSGTGVDPIGARPGNRQSMGPPLDAQGSGRAYRGVGNFLVPGLVSWNRH